MHLLSQYCKLYLSSCFISISPTDIIISTHTQMLSLKSSHGPTNISSSSIISCSSSFYLHNKDNPTSPLALSLHLHASLTLTTILTNPAAFKLGKHKDCCPNSVTRHIQVGGTLLSLLYYFLSFESIWKQDY